MPGEAKPLLSPDLMLLERPWWPIENTVPQTALTDTFFLPGRKGQALVSQMYDALHSHKRVMSSQKEDPPDNSPARDSFSCDDAMDETLTPC